MILANLLGCGLGWPRSCSLLRPLLLFSGDDVLPLLLREALAFADLMAFLATAETMLILPVLLVFNECQPFFVFVVVLMPSVGSDQSVVGYP